MSLGVHKICLFHSILVAVGKLGIYHFSTKLCLSYHTFILMQLALEMRFERYGTV